MGLLSFYQDLSQGLKSTGPLQPSIEGVPKPFFLLEYKKNIYLQKALHYQLQHPPTPQNFKPSYSPDEEEGRAADAFELILDFAEKPPF